MKHFLKKKWLQGAGWRSKPRVPDPKPSILRAPNMAGYKILQSYSVMEIIDLISDGPIHGLVNKNGESLGNKSILQAIYLDNTPVETVETSFFNIDEYSLGSYQIAETFNILGDLYYQKETAGEDPYFKPIQLSYHTNTKNSYPLSQYNLLADQSFSFNARKVIFGGLQVKSYVRYLNAKEQTYTSESYWYDLTSEHLNAPSFYVSTPRSNTPFKQDWNMSVFGKNKTNNPVEGVIFSKKLNNNHSIEINITSNKLASEGLLKQFLTTLNTNLNSSSTNQKYFINLAISQIDNLKQRIKNVPLNNEISYSNAPSLITEDAYIIIDIPSFSIPSLNGKSIFTSNSDGTLSSQINDFSFYLDIYLGYQDLVTKLIIPKINANNQFTGEFYGCLIIQIPVTREVYSYYKEYIKGEIYEKLFFNNVSYVFNDLIALFANSSVKLHFFEKQTKREDEYRSIKYNFSNIACEFKNGEEIQSPLSDFKYIYVDYEYDSDLIGPFNKDTSKFIERVTAVDRRNSSNQLVESFSAANPKLVGDVNSSIDKRTAPAAAGGAERNFGVYNDAATFNEQPVPFTHIIENANVEFVAFTLAINSLYDTLDADETDTSDKVQDWTRKIGERRPAVLRIKVEVGTNIDGIINTEYTKQYAVIALTEGQMLIDFGDPSLKGRGNFYLAVRDFTDGTNKPSELNEIFPLPKIDKDKNSTNAKRFIKIYKTSAETNSVLIKKEAGVYKVTEIIPNKLSYPFSAITGIKLDSRVFSTPPERSYDCRLKLVKIPSNYYPLDENKRFIDKRYIKDKSTYNQNMLIYKGDWDGNFKTAWTDNPAWIIYDMLTSKRYGIGSHLESFQINKWELYKIGRFCDAVDDEGYFIGVSDGIGGLEPRYSCNIVFKEASKIYDSIVSITNLFRGMCYFYNSEVHFVDDRPRLPIITFTNNNVKDGIFNYSNTRRDQQYNTIEVSYLDRFDNFQCKVEYVEDEEDIRKRGFRKTIIETFGVTSRAMARRIGQHMIYQTIKENQAVEFNAGLEALLCRPGDLMIIEDDLKTRSVNQGKILSINTTNKSILIENAYLPDEFNGKITLYVPTGHQTSEDIQRLASISRSRLPYFDITGNLINSSDNILTGRYYFSKYENNNNWSNLSSSFQQYPLYTGLSNIGHKIFCYYSNISSGFVFSTGLPHQDNNVYDKVVTDESLNKISDIFLTENVFQKLNSGYRYQTSNINRRGTSSNLTGKIKTFTDEYNGILESEIDANSNSQIINYYITGYDILDYGSRVFLDQNNININLLNFVPVGSTYRIGRNNAEDQIYKILAVREENQNEYTIVGSKFNTGKFIEIENFSKEDFLPETYYSGPSKVGNVDIKELKAPEITNFTTGVLEIDSFSLKANWLHNLDALKYRYNVYNETFNVRYTGETTQNSININKVNYLGDWKIDLYSVGNGGSKIDSQASKSGIFVAYYQKGFNKLTKAAITNFTIT